MDSKSELVSPIDPDFNIGKDQFEFPNGDKYVGEYCAHRSGIVWREGIGTYTTHEGQSYKGEWRDDKLVEQIPIEVTYPSGEEYHGCIVKNKYDGPAIYIFDNKMALLCEFINNKPVGDISLIDIKGREWHGVACPDDVLLYPEHIYFNSIPDNSGKGWHRFQRKAKSRMSDNSDAKNVYGGSYKTVNKSFLQHTGQSKLLLTSQHSKSLLMSQSQVSKSLLQGQKGTSHRKSKMSDAPTKLPSKTDMIEKERLMKEELKIFAKTRKTVSDLQLESSDWYKNYVDFKAVFEDIKNKISKDGRGSLNEDEKIWYQKYLKFRERYCEIMKGRKRKYKDLTEKQMFGLFESEEFKNKCPPVMVVYPTEDCGSICDCEVIDVKAEK